jgi:replicative DNA helicase
MNLSDLTAEKNLLGAVLAENRLVDDTGLRPEDFSHPKLSAVFRTVREIIVSGGEVNLVSLPDELARRKQTVDLGLLGELTIPSTANMRFYARRIRDLSAKRVLQEAAREVLDEIGSTVPAEELAEKMERALTAASVDREQELVPWRQTVMDAVDAIEKRHQAGGRLNGLCTGIGILDNVLQGLKSGTLTILGARPSVGKSALAELIALNLARSGVTVGLFSAEMSEQQIAERGLSIDGMLRATGIGNGHLDAVEWRTLVSTAGRLAELPLLIDDNPNISLADLRSRARWMRRKGVGFLIVDYLTLIRHGDPRMPRHERVGEISKSLKQLARELALPILALSQVGRDAADRAPTLADLRQSGEVEEDADAVILLHPDGDEFGTVHVEVAKNRNGGTGKFTLRFDKAHLRFAEVVR